jgi:hypothetical protein
VSYYQAGSNLEKIEKKESSNFDMLRFIQFHELGKKGNGKK